MNITIRDEYIKLGQALKLSGAAQSGVDAKHMIAEGLVTVNGEVDLRRGRKVRPGDVVNADGEEFTVYGMVRE